MIPFAAEIGIRNHRRRPLQLWIPLALLWILLLPVVILLLPLFLIACLAGDSLRFAPSRCSGTS
jgi:hypothetical protein